MKALKFYANEALRWCVKWLLISIIEVQFHSVWLTNRGKDPVRVDERHSQRRRV